MCCASVWPQGYVKDLIIRDALNLSIYCVSSDDTLIIFRDKKNCKEKKNHGKKKKVLHEGVGWTEYVCVYVCMYVCMYVVPRYIVSVSSHCH